MEGGKWCVLVIVMWALACGGGGGEGARSACAGGEVGGGLGRSEVGISFVGCTWCS